MYVNIVDDSNLLFFNGNVETAEVYTDKTYSTLHLQVDTLATHKMR